MGLLEQCRGGGIGHAAILEKVAGSARGLVGRECGPVGRGKSTGKSSFHRPATTRLIGTDQRR
jgi:hypothetical protein